MYQLSDTDPWQILLVNLHGKTEELLVGQLETLQTETRTAQRVQSAVDPTQALFKMHETAIDCIIIDPGAPDPETAITEIDTLHGADPNTAIIILSDDPSEEWTRHSDTLNINAILCRSDIETDLLLSVIPITVLKSRDERQFGYEACRFKEIIHNLPDAYFELDLSGNYTYVNKVAEIHLGRPLEELRRINPMDIIPEHQHKKMVDRYRNMHQNNLDHLLYENEIIRPDGSLINTEISVSLMRDDAGRPIGFFGISRDVTEKKIAQERLRQSEEKHRAILENMEEGYFETNFKGEVQFASKTLCAMLGLDKASLIGNTILGYMDDNNAHRVIEEFKRIHTT